MDVLLNINYLICYLTPMLKSGFVRTFTSSGPRRGAKLRTGDSIEATVTAPQSRE